MRIRHVSLLVAVAGIISCGIVSGSLDKVVGRMLMGNFDNIAATVSTVSGYLPGFNGSAEAAVSADLEVDVNRTSKGDRAPTTASTPRYSQRPTKNTSFVPKKDDFYRGPYSPFWRNRQII